METDKQSHLRHLAKSSAASLKTSGTPPGSECDALSGVILWKEFVCFSVLPLALCHTLPTHTALLTSSLWANLGFFSLPSCRTEYLPVCFLLMLLHKSRHSDNPWSWQPSAQEQGDLLMPSPGCLDLLVRQGASLMLYCENTEGTQRKLWVGMYL